MEKKHETTDHLYEGDASRQAFFEEGTDDCLPGGPPGDVKYSSKYGGYSDDRRVGIQRYRRRGTGK